MSIPAAEIEGAGIVLVGSFNPAIFQPEWFGRHAILREAEAETAKTEIVSPEVTSFGTDWLLLQATRERFQASTADVRYVDPLADLVRSVFTLLEHTPLRQLGINRDMHFPASVDFRNRFADILAPKPHWKAIFDEPLLETLTMLGTRKGSEAKTPRVTVQPSLRVNPGIYVGTNEHYDVGDAQTPDKILSLLVDSWSPAQAYSKHIANHLLSLVTK